MLSPSQTQPIAVPQLPAQLCCKTESTIPLISPATLGVLQYNKLWPYILKRQILQHPPLRSGLRAAVNLASSRSGGKNKE